MATIILAETSTARLRRHLHLILAQHGYSDLTPSDKREVLRRVVLDLAVQERQEHAAKRVDFRGVD